MALNRKGVFFSLTALVIVAILFIILNNPPERGEQEIVQFQVKEITEAKEDYINDLELLFRQQSLTTLRSMARYFAPFPSEFLMQQGFHFCMQDYSCVPRDRGGLHVVNPGPAPQLVIQNLDQEISDLSRDYLITHNLFTNATLVRANVTQISRWELLIEGTFNITIRDSVAQTGFRTVEQITSIVRIDTLTDPFVSGIVGRHVNFQPFEFPNQTNRNWSQKIFDQHISEGSYIADNNGSSYTMRMTGQGNFSGSPWGLKSILPPDTYPPYLAGTCYSYIDNHAGRIYNVTMVVVPNPGGEVLIPVKDAFIYDIYSYQGVGSAVQLVC